MNIIQLIKYYLSTQKYCYVPPCPRCHSKKTGYIIADVRNETTEQYKLRKLQNGELVQIHASLYDHNLFCENCGAEWTGEYEIKRLTDEEIEEQKQIRGITEEYIFNHNFTRKNIKKFKTHIPVEEKETKTKTKKISEQNVKIKK